MRVLESVDATLTHILTTHHHWYDSRLHIATVKYMSVSVPPFFSMRRDHAGGNEVLKQRFPDIEVIGMSFLFLVSPNRKCNRL
jgi:hypothetical protein